jgi:hypothetical protein
MVGSGGSLGIDTKLRGDGAQTIFHITSVENLAAIIAAGELVSDVIMNQQGGPAQTIGMGQIKRRRLTLPLLVA